MKVKILQEIRINLLKYILPAELFIKGVSLAFFLLLDIQELHFHILCTLLYFIVCFQLNHEIMGTKSIQKL